MDVALAICVQKYDVWKPLVDFHKSAGRPIIDATSIEYFVKRGAAGLDLTEINIVSGIVRNMLKDTAPQLVALAESHFQHVRYFPVSALGHSPQEHDGFLKIRPIDIQPFRADHPFLWLMHRWDMIPRLKSKQENPDGLQMAKVRSIGRGMLEVRCPTSGEPLFLDADHAGRKFYNPNSTEFFWIPSVELTERVRASANTSPTHRNAPPQGQGLKLNNSKTNSEDEEKPAKKSWWPFK